MVRINGSPVMCGGTRCFAESRAETFRWKGADNAEKISRCLSCDKRVCDNCMANNATVSRKATRERVIELLKGGMYPCYIARAVGVHPSTVTRIRKSMKEDNE